MTRFLKAAAVVLMLVAGVSTTTTTAQAQSSPLKVGFTNVELLTVNMPAYQNVQRQLQTELQQQQATLQDSMAVLQEKADRYQKQQALLSPERRAEREQELMMLQARLQQRAQQAEAGLAQREQELMQPLFERVRGALEEVAEAKSIDIVLSETAILYINEDKIVDITLDVARKLGIEVDESAGTAGVSN